SGRAWTPPRGRRQPPPGWWCRCARSRRRAGLELDHLAVLCLIDTGRGGPAVALLGELDGAVTDDAARLDAAHGLQRGAQVRTSQLVTVADRLGHALGHDVHDVPALHPRGADGRRVGALLLQVLVDDVVALLLGRHRGERLDEDVTLGGLGAGGVDERLVAAPVDADGLDVG